MKIVEHIVEFVDGLGELVVKTAVRLDRPFEENLGLFSHTPDEVAGLIVDLGALESAHRLGDVGAEVAAALDVGVHMHCGHDRPEIAGHRLFANQRLYAVILDLLGDEIELVVVQDDAVGAGNVATEEHLSDFVDPLSDKRHRFQEQIADRLEPFVEFGANLVHISQTGP